LLEAGGATLDVLPVAYGAGLHRRG
jgi:hypothetical protein